jgi:hypothetical protein
MGGIHFNDIPPATVDFECIFLHLSWIVNDFGPHCVHIFRNTNLHYLTTLGSQRSSGRGSSIREIDITGARIEFETTIYSMSNPSRTREVERLRAEGTG